MDFLLAGAVFLGAMLLCVFRDWALYWALALALALFFAVGLRRGHTAKALAKMAWSKMPATLIVLRIIFLIGLLTGLWRSCGTIAFFIWYGVRAISPRLFVLLAFLLSALLSYALGTSFGVTSTAGVVLMALARSGGVDPAVAAGAILSGVYFGDRGAPTSSCASLVAALTETELYGNVKRMHRTALLPYLICLAAYAFLSLRHPVSAADETLLRALAERFDLSAWVVLPAAIMLVLPLLHVPIWIAMSLSGAVSAAVGILLQGMGVWEALRVCLLGFAPEGVLASVLSGGGLVSMLTVFLMLPLASMMSGILEGTGALNAAQERIDALSARIGLLPATALLSILCSMVLCNQTIVVIMLYQLMGRVYRSRGASNEEFAMDIANSGVTIAGLVPWCIACAVPLSMLGVGVGALPYAVLLYAIPICYLFTKRKFYPKGEPS
ncbi:MAG: sodium:proton antiporter [Ruminococcaceae bacterium]|nr:sodium:proton antiporter [Oscillospiraceae bacterium]